MSSGVISDVENATRFLILFKKNVDISEPEMVKILSARFQLNQETIELLSKVFLLEDYPLGESLNRYAASVGVPFTLEDQDLEQARNWLSGYSPSIWLALEQGRLPMLSHDLIRNTELQCRFLIELKPLLSWVEIARAFCTEFKCKLVKNMASDLFRSYLSRIEFPVWAQYAIQSSSGTLMKEDAEQAQYWRDRYAAGQTSQRAMVATDDMSDMSESELFSFRQCLFLDQLFPYLPLGQLAKSFCAEFSVPKYGTIWYDLGKSRRRRKTEANWIKYDKRRLRHGLTISQQEEVEEWTVKYVPSSDRQRALQNEQKARANWVQDQSRCCSASDALLMAQMEAAGSDRSPTSRSNWKCPAKAFQSQRAPLGLLPIEERTPVIRSTKRQRSEPQTRSKRPRTQQPTASGSASAPILLEDED